MAVGGAFLEFTTGTPGGTCGNIRTGANALIRNLTCGGLNIGGGGSVVSEGPTPDGSKSQFSLVCQAGGACDGACAGSICTIGPTSTAPPLNSTAPDCTNTGCNFGTPLPIPNFAQPALTTCALNTWASPASGTLNISTGASSTSVPLTSDVYLTGIPDQPCPKCVAGVCDRGPRAGSPCTSGSSTGYTRDCPTGGVGTLASQCPGGQQPANGQTCCSPLCAGDGVTPCATANGDADCIAGGTTGPCVSPGHCTNAPATACTTNANCVAPGICVPCDCSCTAGGGPCCDGGHVGALGVTLSPLTTGAASTTSSVGRFCTGQGTGTHVGCFGNTTCRTINENGSAAGQVLTNVPAAATLGSVFCIPATSNAVVNGSADLPGPGAVSLPGTYEAHN
jgi:hypothetical protein